MPCYDPSTPVISTEDVTSPAVSLVVMKNYEWPSHDSNNQFMPKDTVWTNEILS